MHHSYDLCVYYSDTDAGGVVYHANYLKFCEHARVEFFRSIGFSLSELMQNDLGFTIRHCSLDFNSPLVFDDRVEVQTSIKDVGNSKIVFSHSLIKKANQNTVAHSECVLIAVNSKYQKQIVSDALRLALSPYFL
jgi:acyl-CoA thioester hydrolase